MPPPKEGQIKGSEQQLGSQDYQHFEDFLCSLPGCLAQHQKSMSCFSSKQNLASSFLDAYVSEYKYLRFTKPQDQSPKPGTPWTKEASKQFRKRTERWMNMKYASSNLLCSDMFHFSFQCKEKYKHCSFLTWPEDECCHVRKKKLENHDPSSLWCLKTKTTSRATNNISTSLSLGTFGSYCISRKHLCASGEIQHINCNTLGFSISQR